MMKHIPNAKNTSTNIVSMAAPKRQIELVDLFRTNHNHYSRADYKEAHVRQEFIDPMFELLGWDMSNRQGYAEQYKEVIHEDALRVGRATKAPDYCFRIGGVRKFFLEAKKPSVKLKEDVPAAFQVRRYAWSAGLPLSILTDFEEFAVYDCRIEPHRHDKAAVARVMYFTYEEYIERWEELLGIFSKEAILRGSFDRYAESTKKKRGTAEVDDAFLAEIEEWREMLAKNIALKNSDLSVRELNHAVQSTIDRIIFLRIAEDRGIEEYGRLLSLRNGENVYPRLVQLYHQADRRYNSGLFHFEKEKGREGTPDEWTIELTIDDKPLKEIFRRLYYPESPYEFSVLPVDILGQVYERFLGKVIRLTSGHRAKVELKPEVRKAGGVFYTPSFVVDYIVDQTLGTWLNGKSLKEVEALRLVDPACGSGSFLLGAYRHLLSWHLDWYQANDPEKWAKKKSAPIYQTISSDPTTPPGYRLTTQEKKKILLNNIYGVDIDEQAVEVTKLSLLLAVLEGESGETIGAQMRLLEERVLPDLSNTIKCGNSLVGSDVFADPTVPTDDPERMRALNPFDWEREFPEIFRAGGFHVVVGNPPYVRQETLGDIKNYLSSHYETSHGTADLYVYFIEKGYRLLRDGGYFSYIVANKWMRANYGGPLREWMEEKKILELIDFGDLPVFQGATTYPCILVLEKGKPHGTFTAAELDTLEFISLEEEVQSRSFTMENRRLDRSGWTLMDTRTADLLEKLKGSGVPLGEYVEGKIYYGIKTGLNEAFVIDEATRERLISADPKSEEIIKPFLRGRDIKRYQQPEVEQYVLFARRGVDIDSYPAIKEHLLQYKSRLMPKPKGWKGAWEGRKPGSYEWYEIQDTVDYYQEFEKGKIMFPDIGLRLNMTLDPNAGMYFANTGYMICSEDLSLLGLLNSSAIDFVYRAMSSSFRGGYLRAFSQYIAQLPVPREKRITELVAPVSSLLALNQQLQTARTSHDKSLLTRQIEATDKEIDRLVYELYKLSEGEIAVIEAANQ